MCSFLKKQNKTVVWSFAQRHKSSSFTHSMQKKKTADQSCRCALGLWKRRRAQHCEGRVIIISCSDQEPALCKQQQRSGVWRCSISRGSSVPFPSSYFKGNINNSTPQIHSRQRQTTATPSQRSSIFWRLTSVQMCEQMKAETLRAAL